MWDEVDSQTSVGQLVKVASLGVTISPSVVEELCQQKWQLQVKAPLFPTVNQGSRSLPKMLFQPEPSEVSYPFIISARK